jgi:hypothetical protein
VKPYMWDTLQTSLNHVSFCWEHDCMWEWALGHCVLSP